jgi:hypothetical protein
MAAVALPVGTSLPGRVGEVDSALLSTGEPPSGAMLYPGRDQEFIEVIDGDEL